MKRASLILAAALAACGGDPETRTAQQVALDEAEALRVEREPPAAWGYAGDAEAPEARFGPSIARPQFALVCDREQESMRLRLTGVPPGGVTRLNVVAPGAERTLDGRADAGAIEALVLLADPLLAAMAAPAARIMVSAGSEPPLSLPGGAAVRRTVEVCRRPIEEPIAGARYEGTLPCPDCEGIDVTLQFEGAAPAAGRYRLVRSYRGTDRVLTQEGLVVVEQDVDGAVYRLDPEAGGGETLWVDQPEPGVLLVRDARGAPDPELDRAPLFRR